MDNLRDLPINHGNSEFNQKFILLHYRNNSSTQDRNFKFIAD